MVLTSDTYPSAGYNQQSYTVAQEGYCYPQTGYPYSTPMGTGYNSSPVSHDQYQNFPTGHVYGNQYGHGHGHGHGHEKINSHKYQAQNQHHGMTTYSAANMGFGGNQCPPMGHVYGPSYGSGPGKYGKIYSAYKEADD